MLHNQYEVQYPNFILPLYFILPVYFVLPVSVDMVYTNSFWRYWRVNKSYDDGSNQELGRGFRLGGSSGSTLVLGFHFGSLSIIFTSHVQLCLHLDRDFCPEERGRAVHVFLLNLYLSHMFLFSLCCRWWLLHLRLSSLWSSFGLHYLFSFFLPNLNRKTFLTF